jgi:circadian clock protein KaiC
MKMRGRPTEPGLHTFRISASGIHVFSPARLAVGNGVDHTLDPSVRLRTGVPALDEMMGGGLPKAYSLLVAGPSGSGKSILAGAFLLEGAIQGETGVIAAFEQRPSESRGAELADLIQQGRIGVVDTRAASFSVDEIAMLVIAEVHRLKATRVVIDWLSGFELTLAPTFPRTSASRSRVVSALASTGVTVLGPWSVIWWRRMAARSWPPATALIWAASPW